MNLKKIGTVFLLTAGLLGTRNAQAKTTYEEMEQLTVNEALEQIPEHPTHTFVQGGVGGLAAGSLNPAVPSSADRSKGETKVQRRRPKNQL